MPSHRWCSCFLATSYLLLSSFGFAEDWPQWMGPSRDNRWSAEGIIKKFPTDGPKILWRVKVSNGYAGPAVVGNRVYVTDFATEENVKIPNFDRKEAQGMERVFCRDAATGGAVWEYGQAVTYGISYPSGPRCTPLVDENRVYTLGAEGSLICFDRESGEVLWNRELKTDYHTGSALWGYASHPLIDGEKLICIVGGTGSHTVAFNKRTGSEIWRWGTAEEQGYCPPSIIESGGKRQLIVASPEFIAALDPDSGSEYWKQDYGASSGSVIMTPIHSGNYLFLGGYSNRNLMLELNPDQPGAMRLFRDKPKLGISPVNVQPFLEGNVMYGADQSGELMAVEIPSGKRLWTTGQPVSSDRAIGNATSFIVKNGDLFYLFTDAGELVIAQLSPSGYEEIDRAKVIEPTNNAFNRPVVWSMPAFANGRMFVRNDEELVAVELTASRQ